MRNDTSPSRNLFLIFDYAFLCIIALICIFPIINVLAISFSSSTAASAGIVKLLPVDFTIESYKYVFTKIEFWRSTIVSLKRMILGVPANMILTCLIAYPLSRKTKNFRIRKIYAWYFIITTFFSGGLIPTYVIVSKTGLINTIWSLIIPGAVPVFNVIILLNFFRQLPVEIEESAFIDGAGHWLTLLKIYIPLSLPSLATVLLFTCVNHWNAWFDGIIYMNRPENYPLQSYLQTVVILPNIALISNLDNAKAFANVSDRTFKAAQIFLGALPILMVYPFLQKYFMTGIVLGSVKG